MSICSCDSCSGRCYRAPEAIKGDIVAMAKKLSKQFINEGKEYDEEAEAISNLVEELKKSERKAKRSRK